MLRSEFLKFHLPAIARQNPGIEITVSPRPAKHPVIRGSYINGREKVIDCRNITPNEIAQKVELLRNANGEKLKRTRQPVKSLNESVRGVWSPHHGFMDKFEHKI